MTINKMNWTPQPHGLLTEEQREFISAAWAVGADVWIYNDAGWDTLTYNPSKVTVHALKTDWERPAEKPKYKTFDLGSDINGFFVLSDRGAVRSVTRYPVVDGYRIFGFGNDSVYDPAKGSYVSPIDSQRKYTYAYGRLEEN